MACKPESFESVVELLIKASTQEQLVSARESYLRSAFSRRYYHAYHVGDVWAKRNGYTDQDRDAGYHRSLWTFINGKLGVNSFINVALDEVHQDRVAADYELDRDFPPAGRDPFKNLDKFLEFLKILPPTLPQEDDLRRADTTKLRQKWRELFPPED